MVLPRSFYILPFASLAFGAVVTEVVTVTTTVGAAPAPTAQPVTKVLPVSHAVKVAEIQTTVPTSSASPASHVASGADYNSAKSYTSDDDFQGSILTSTNAFRQEHNASPLSWNDTLARYAASHASGCVFQHTKGPYGENLAAGYASVETAVDGWGDERTSYNFASGGFGENTGHFTQLVWKATTSVGCGRVYCNKAGTPGWYLMCEYYPRGNMAGSYQQNVLSRIVSREASRRAER